MLPSFLSLVGLIEIVSYIITKITFAEDSFQVSAQHFDKAICDAKIMRKLDDSHCNCNEYKGYFSLGEICRSKCEKEIKQVNKNESCCYAKCIIDNSIVVDGKINKTAMASLYGKVGDPKTAENIEECKDIGRRNL